MEKCANFCPHQVECADSTPGMIFEMLYDGKVCYSLAISAITNSLGFEHSSKTYAMIGDMYDQYIEDRNAGQVEGDAQ